MTLLKGAKVSPNTIKAIANRAGLDESTSIPSMREIQLSSNRGYDDNKSDSINLYSSNLGDSNDIEGSG